MLHKFRLLYEKNLAVKVITVLVVVFCSIIIMLPLLELAELFGVNIRGNGGLNFKVELGNVFFFFLFGGCTVSIIWLAQKYLHKKKFQDLGFRSKIFKPFFFGFLIGVIQIGLGYLILGLNAQEVKYVPILPNDVSILVYIGYYIYFFFGMLVWNSFIEEVGTRAYPIETLKNYLNPHIIFIVMGILFTVFHFIVHEFNFTSFIGIFIASYILSLAYYYSKSIWLAMGLHTGINWFNFSFSGGTTNWKLGGIMRIEIYDIPTWIYSITDPIIGIIVILLILYANKKGFFKKLCDR